MAIEDVGYMLAHSEKDADMFFVESQSRNTDFYKSPNYYTVDFSTPFKNVYGLEILDASIPTTMYNIDYINDKLSYGYVFANPNPNPTAVTPPLTFTDVADELQVNTVYAAFMERIDVESLHMFVLESSATHTAPGWQVPTNVLVIGRNVTPAPDVQLQTGKSRDPAYTYFTWGGQVYATQLPDVITAVTDPTGFHFYPGNTASHPTPQVVTFDARYVTDPFSNFADTATNNLPTWDFCVNMRYVAIENGNYDITTLMNYLNKRVALDTDGVFITDPIKIGAPSTTSTDIGKRSIYKLSSSTEFFFDLSRSTAGPSMGFGKEADLFTDPTYDIHYLRNKALLAHARFATDTNTYSMLTPGIVNLQGIRYIILRCPEIESHMYGSFAYSSQCPGIGMFKLSSGNDITHLRFDFVNFVKKPFHPVGKLSRLTFRFELPGGGGLYDFKGVDHNMLMMVKYYVATGNAQNAPPTLNPNYDADYVKYMIEHMRPLDGTNPNNAGDAANDDDDDDDDDAETDEDQDAATRAASAMNRTLMEQNKYDISSEEDSDEGEEHEFEYTSAASYGASVPHGFRNPQPYR